MAMPARAAMPPPNDPSGRSFALLDQAERERLAAVLLPLPWVDGFITAIIISPEEPEDWPDYVYAPDVLDTLELAQEEDATSAVDNHFMHIVDTLYDDPEAYRPYFNGSGDRMEAAAQWAAGFRFGIRLAPEPWRPLLEDEDARSLLGAIFSLERDEDIPEAERAESPFRDMPADRREHMRRTALEVLPGLVLALHTFSLGLDEGNRA
jgi:yecA family protein